MNYCPRVMALVWRAMKNCAVFRSIPVIKLTFNLSLKGLKVAEEHVQGTGNARSP